MWEGFHYDRKIPISISVEYDEELKQYFVEVIRGEDRILVSFLPKKSPEDNLMHVSDVERSVKIANNSIKQLKKEAKRRKK